MAVLGAATALCLINGMSTPPLDPVFLHFLIHNCELDSINPAFLGEWHPDLKRTIQDWISLGPDGDPSPFQMHFATYHDLQVSCAFSAVPLPLIGFSRLPACMIEIKRPMMHWEQKCSIGL